MLSWSLSFLFAYLVFFLGPVNVDQIEIREKTEIQLPLQPYLSNTLVEPEPVYA